MTTFRFLLAVGGIAILASTGAALAADQSGTVYPVSAAGQQAYADAIHDLAVNRNAGQPVLQTANATIYAVSPAADQAAVDETLAIAALNTNAVPSQINPSAVYPASDAGQEANADAVHALAVSQNGNLARTQAAAQAVRNN